MNSEFTMGTVMTANRKRLRVKAASIILLAMSALVASDCAASDQERGDGSGHPTRAAEQPMPGGVFSLWPMVETFPRATELKSPSVSGLSARFAWSSMEPQPGAYQWDALDAAHDLTMATEEVVDGARNGRDEESAVGL